MRFYSWYFIIQKKVVAGTEALDARVNETSVGFWVSKAWANTDIDSLMLLANKIKFFKAWLGSASPTAYLCFYLLVVKHASGFKAIDAEKAWILAADGAFDRALTPGIGSSSKPNIIALCK